ncbi:MAG: ATP-binding cassette domain-containing protein [bacterium]
MDRTIDLSLKLDAITKRYGRSTIFSPISAEIHSAQICAITGANGSGKSTLLKIIAGVTEPSSGSSSWSADRKIIDSRKLQTLMGFASPYLELYHELTAVEHLQFVAELKGKRIVFEECVSELTQFGLEEKIVRSDRAVKAYSSGMQQRVRLAMAFMLQPSIILLDEPSSNLDEAGIAILSKRIEESRDRGAIVIIASNDEAEKKLASSFIDLIPAVK